MSDLRNARAVAGLSGTVTGVMAIPRGVVDSARAAGFSESDIVRQVELPLAAPSIVGGIPGIVPGAAAVATVTVLVLASLGSGRGQSARKHRPPGLEPCS